MNLVRLSHRMTVALIVLSAVALTGGIAAAQSLADLNSELGSISGQMSAAESNEATADQVIGKLDGAEATFAAADEKNLKPLLLGLGIVLRALGEPPDTLPRQPGLRLPASDVADLLVGTAWGAARLSGRLAARGARISAPARSIVSWLLAGRNVIRCPVCEAR
jgi:hypothetical protein